MDLPALYRDLVESSPDAIWVTDLDGRTIYANDAFARLYGVPREEVGSVTVFDTLDEPGRAQFAEHLRLVRAGVANAEDVEVLFHDAHGTATWVSVRESLLHRDGALVGLVNRVQSYQHRRQVLDELRAGREALQEAQALAGIGAWTYDLATQRVEMLGGVRLLAPVGEQVSPESLLQVVHPDDVAPVVRAARDAVERTGEFEVDVRVVSGETWVHLRVRGLVHRAADGSWATITGTHQDITAVRIAELALRDEVVQNALMRRIATAANAAHSLHDVLDIVRPLLSGHDEWVRSAGFRIDEAGVFEALDETATAHDEELCREAVRSGAPVWSEDRCTVAFRVGNDERSFGAGAITASEPVERTELVEVMVDAVGVQLARVAEREEDERALAAARDAAMTASRQKSEFMATMSHEIRTPLNGIIGLTDLLQRTPLAPDQQRLTAGMRDAGHALLGVLNDVLDFSRLDARSVELEQVDVDVRSMLDQVARVLAGAARGNDVDLVVWCDPDVPPLVLSDPTRLSQVLMNLVSNGVKFSAGGEVVVHVSVPEAEDDRVRLRLEVADTGIGIEPDQLEHLFEPFTQADASTTRRFGGTGLGLSIAREIVTALGGEIGYAARPGGGSVFSFEVWCERREGGVADLDEYARTWLSGRRVLVADGSPQRATARQQQLRWWRVDVDTAPDVDGVRTLLADSVAAERPYEAVLIDARVGGGGLVLVGEIAGDPAYDQVAMIVIGSDGEVDLGRLREAGVSVVLDRPVTADTLRGTLLEQLVGVPAQPTGRPEPATQGTDLPRILVVEDNVVNQIVATGLLASLDYRSEVVQNGAEALEVLARESFDAVLMDVQMPVLDGYAATRTLREREAEGVHLPVIAMTAAAIAGERERCLAAGMDEFLTKPVDRSALAAALERWVVRTAPSTPAAAPVPSAPPAAPAAALPPTGAIAGLDTARLDMLRDLDPGDTTYIDRAIGNFQTNSVVAETAIAELAAVGDVAGLKAAAHKIAGSALNLGVPRAGEAARALEHLTETGTTEGAEELLGELHAAMAEARALLLAYRATYAP
jgi:PAS domain S-box-containing protein